MKKKELLDGYVGVKFKSRCLSPEAPAELRALYEDFSYNTGRLREKNMTHRNAGNISCRFQDGFVITASGSNLGSLETDELIYVTGCALEDEMVCYRGPTRPSSETFMHYLIYEHHPEALAIIHAHDEVATSGQVLSGELLETVREEPYGTIALARLAIETFSEGHHLILLKNHGYVAIGKNLTEAADRIVAMHDRLMKKVKPPERAE